MQPDTVRDVAGKAAAGKAAAGKAAAGKAAVGEAAAGQAVKWGDANSATRSGVEVDPRLRVRSPVWEIDNLPSPERATRMYTFFSPDDSEGLLDSIDKLRKGWTGNESFSGAHRISLHTLKNNIVVILENSSLKTALEGLVMLMCWMDATQDGAGKAVAAAPAPELLMWWRQIAPSAEVSSSSLVGPDNIDVEEFFMCLEKGFTTAPAAKDIASEEEAVASAEEEEEEAVAEEVPLVNDSDDDPLFFTMDEDVCSESPDFKPVCSC